jgi:hypothetical protein
MDNSPETTIDPPTMVTTFRKGLVKINNNSNVYQNLKAGDKYYMYLTESDTLLHVRCDYVAIRAADMMILSKTQRGVVLHDDDGSYFGYQFEHFDAVHFTSFQYREKCELYFEQDIYIQRQMSKELIVVDEE